MQAKMSQDQSSFPFSREHFCVKPSNCRAWFMFQIPLWYGKPGNKKHATCSATLLQNELNSNVAHLPRGLPAQWHHSKEERNKLSTQKKKSAHRPDIKTDRFKNVFVNKIIFRYNLWSFYYLYTVCLMYF